MQHTYAKLENDSSYFSRGEVQGGPRLRVSALDRIGFFCLISIGVLLIYLIVSCFLRAGDEKSLSRLFDISGEVCTDSQFAYAPNPFVPRFVCTDDCGSPPVVDLSDGPMGKPSRAHHRYEAHPGAMNLCVPSDRGLAHVLLIEMGKAKWDDVLRSIGGPLASQSEVLPTLAVSVILCMIYVFTGSSIYIFTLAGAAASIGSLCGFTMLHDYIDGCGEKTSEVQVLHPVGCGLQLAASWSVILAAAVLVALLLVSTTAIRTSLSVTRECQRMASLSKGAMYGSIFAILAIGAPFLSVMTRLAGQAMGSVVVSPAPVDLFGRRELVNTASFAYENWPYYVSLLFVSLLAVKWVNTCVLFIQCRAVCRGYFLMSSHNSGAHDKSGGAAGAAAESERSSGRDALHSDRSHQFSVQRAFLQESTTKMIETHLGSITLFSLVGLVTVSSRYLEAAWAALAVTLGADTRSAMRRRTDMDTRWQLKVQDLATLVLPTARILTLSVVLLANSAYFWYIRLTNEGGDVELENVDRHSSAHAALWLPILTLLTYCAVKPAAYYYAGIAACLSMCYKMDIEMSGGSESDAVYVSRSLAEVFDEITGFGGSKAT